MKYSVMLYMDIGRISKVIGYIEAESKDDAAKKLELKIDVDFQNEEAHEYRIPGTSVEIIIDELKEITHLEEVTDAAVELDQARRGFISQDWRMPM
jgi:hypothetical protein